MKVYENADEAYLGTLADVYDNPEYTASPRGQKTREITDCTFRILNPVAKFIETKDPERNETIKLYSDKEFKIYNKCTNRVEDFIKISKFWGKLANPDGTINSAYGYLIWKNPSMGCPKYEHALYDKYVKELNEAQAIGAIEYPELVRLRNEFKEKFPRTPWEWAKTSLLNDKDTRQAILRFSLPQHQYLGNKDQTCTLHGNFMIRENKLNLSITMRSNDLMLGLVYDLPWFIFLIYRMRDELKETYPDLEIGHYTHTSHSMHIYDKNEEAILKMLGRK